MVYDDRKNQQPSAKPLPASPFVPFAPINQSSTNYGNNAQQTPKTFAPINQNSTNYANNAQQPTKQNPLQTPLTQPLPGATGYTPTTAPYGQDLSNPGVKEQHWDQNQQLWMNGAFAGPGDGQQFWHGVQGDTMKRPKT